MRLRSLILLGMLAYAVALVFTFPAVHLLRWVDPAPAKLFGVEGTVWRGGAQQVEVNGIAVEQVRWRFQPASLARGELAVALDGRYAGGPLSGRVALDWRRAVHLREVDYRLDARRLVDFMPLPIAEFSGEISTRVDKLTLQGGTLGEVTGKLRWPGATLTSPLETVLGDYRVDLDTTERGYRAVLEGSGGSLGANGEVRVQGDGRYDAQITFRPARDAPRELVQQLGFVTRRQGNGSYLLRRSGSLREFW